MRDLTDAQWAILQPSSRPAIVLAARVLMTVAP